ncbi:MAG: hypothetical protein N3E46_02795, partial [Gemmataceae bacterium]|nr:hypothetical protein [Gemmataceae bacterium]
MYTLPLPPRFFLTLAFLASGLAALVHSAEVEVAPPPRLAQVQPVIRTAVDLDRAVLAEIRQRSQIMRNLQYLS